MSPQYVKPYVKSNKNDYNDAEVICEAVTRPNMRFVPNKSIELPLTLFDPIDIAVPRLLGSVEDFQQAV